MLQEDAAVPVSLSIIFAGAVAARAGGAGPTEVATPDPSPVALSSPAVVVAATALADEPSSAGCAEGDVVGELLEEDVVARS